MKRIVLAAILGGLTLFVWMYVAHDVLGIGEMAVGEIPNEAVVLSAMRGAIPEAGFGNCSSHRAQHNCFVWNLSHGHFADPEYIVRHIHPHKQSQATQDSRQHDAFHFRFSFCKLLWSPGTRR